jgi:flagellar hook assembly protein FlgD
LLEPEEVATYTLTWDQRDDNGQQVDYGYYTFRIRTSIGGYGFDGVLVQPPAGMIERTIEVNESQTVNGITVTLKHVAS